MIGFITEDTRSLDYSSRTGALKGIGVSGVWGFGPRGRYIYGHSRQKKWGMKEFWLV